MMMTRAEEVRLIEDNEVLAGRRSQQRRMAAVRIAHLDGILQLPARLQSVKAAGAAPTAAEFDALVTDVAALHTGLMAVMKALQAKLLP